MLIPQKLWRDHWLVVILAVLGLIFLIHLTIAHSAEHGDYLLMDRANLAAAERYLAEHGHQVRAFEGAVLGPESERQVGTGTAALRGRDNRGCWQWWVWQTHQGLLVKMQVYPARRPAGFKGK